MHCRPRQRRGRESTPRRLAYQKPPRSIHPGRLPHVRYVTYQWRKLELFAKSYFSPAGRRRKRHRRSWYGVGDTLHRTCEPQEELTELETLKLERLAHGNLSEKIHVSILDANSEKRERFVGLAFPIHCCCALPLISRSAIGKEKDPWSIISNTVCSLLLLPLLNHVETLLYCCTHRGISTCLQMRREEVWCRMEAAFNLHGAKGNDSDFHSLHRERICRQFVFEGDKPCCVQ